jgi:hypothetical protein
MIWLVVAEAVAICVLGLIVVALVHSYSGLASRVERVAAPLDPNPERERSSEQSAGIPITGSSRARAIDIEGTTTSGEHLVLSVTGVRGDVLLAFLSSTCATCRALWTDLARWRKDTLDPRVRLIVLVKDLDEESPSMLASLSAGAVEIDVVHSSQAWADYDVPGSPYFVHVAGSSGEVVGQGSAIRWGQVAELMDLSARDVRADGARRSAWDKPRRQLRRESGVDAALSRAGILPGDPSLYPESRALPLP